MFLNKAVTTILSIFSMESIVSFLSVQKCHERRIVTQNVAFHHIPFHKRKSEGFGDAIKEKRRSNALKSRKGFEFYLQPLSPIKYAKNRKLSNHIRNSATTS